MFNKIIATVLGFLGISAFAKDSSGKSFLLDEQKKKLTDKWGDKFVASFEADLADMEKDGKPAESVLTQELSAQMKADFEANKKALEDARKQLKALQEKEAAMQADLDKLGKQPGDTDGLKVNGNNSEMKKKFAVDPSFVHNQMFAARASGKSYTGDSTINTTELQTEFGRYVSSDKYEIFRKLVSPLTDTAYMTTVLTDKFEVRASYSQITSVLQSFTPQWTAKGASKFTPLTIKQYPMKINVPVIPSDIIDDVLGYLYDENLLPEQMPIVKYIVEVTIKEILDQERQVAMAQGVYKEPVANESGVYTANDANQVMNGYLTQLCVCKRDSKGNVNFIKSAEAFPSTDAEIVKFMEDFCDAVSPAYKNKKMFIHADPDIVIRYSRAYRNVYKDTKNEDGQKIQVDFTNFTFGPMEGMRGTGAFFITPKENFRHLMSTDPKNQQLRMEHQDYTAKVFGEWREGVGFWIGEAIFAYLPAALVAKLAPVGA